MKEVSGTAKGAYHAAEKILGPKGPKDLPSALHKIIGPKGCMGGCLPPKGIDHPPKKHYAKGKIPGHQWLPVNNGLYDETPSGEQDAMEEVSGTAKGAYHETKNILGPKGTHHAILKKLDKVILHDEDRSGEQDAMKEVSGTSKGLLGTVEHLGDKGAKGAYHAAKKIDKSILHDEDRSGELDAMEEVSGTSKGVLSKVKSKVTYLVEEGAKKAFRAARKIDKSIWYLPR